MSELSDARQDLAPPAGGSGAGPFTLDDPFEWDAGQIAISLPGGRAVFSTRSGGDLAAEPSGSACLRRVVGPRPERWLQDRQVHGRRVRIAAAEPAGPTSLTSDGIVTARRDVACVVRTADCVPLALIAPQAVGVVHGGWRGLAAGVVEEGVRAMRGLGAMEISAAIGPHASACCYEAGDEVHEAFAHLGPGVSDGRHVDLAAVSRALLGQAGVSEVHVAGLCTMCSGAGLLWSHRLEGARAGRQGVIAWRS